MTEVLHEQRQELFNDTIFFSHDMFSKLPWLVSIVISYIYHHIYLKQQHTNKLRTTHIYSRGISFLKYCLCLKLRCKMRSQKNINLKLSVDMRSDFPMLLEHETRDERKMCLLKSYWKFIHAVYLKFVFGISKYPVNRHHSFHLDSVKIYLSKIALGSHRPVQNKSNLFLLLPALLLQ